MSLSFSPNSFKTGTPTPVTVTSSTGTPNLSETTSAAAGYVKNGSPTSVAWTAVMASPPPTATTVNLILTPPASQESVNVGVEVEGGADVDVDVQVDVEEAARGLSKEGGPPYTGTLTINLQGGVNGPIPVSQRILLTIE